MTTALAKILASVADLRGLTAALAEADRAARAARAAVDVTVGFCADAGVREAARAAARETIRTHRGLRRKTVADGLRTRGSGLVALAAEAETVLAGLALRIERDEAFLVDDGALFETGGRS